jgi:hypothetical protein
VTTTLITPHASADIVGQAVLRINGGELGLDALRVPYGSAHVEIGWTAFLDLEDLDPREDVRVIITAGNGLDPDRAFNLGLRERSIDHVAKAVHLELATDEALLQDYATLVIDRGAEAHQASLRAVVNYVLAKIGAVLAPGTDDADATVYYNAVNLLSNPRPSGTRNGYLAASGAGTPVYVADVGGFKAVKWTPSAGSSSILVAPTPTSYRVIPGNTYSFGIDTTCGLAGRNVTAALQWRGEGGATIVGTSYGNTLVSNPALWQRTTVEAVAPAGAEYVQPAVFTTGNTVGTGDHYVKESLFKEGKAVPFFDGATPDTTQYDYGWNDVANASSSYRKPKVAERDPDSLVWKPGVTAWDFLEPLLTPGEFRLFADELRVWRLVKPETYVVPGFVAVSGLNATDGLDRITRDDPEVFATGVVIRYTWQTTGEPGKHNEEFDTAGTPEKVVTFDYNRPFPGAGAAAAILRRRDGTGRTQDVTALAQWRTTPGMQASVSLPNAPQQSGKVGFVRYSLGDDGLMALGARPLIDIVPGTIDALVGTIDALVGTIDAL